MSLALRKMTAAEVKLSPSEKAKMEKAKAKLAKLEKEEQDIKVSGFTSRKSRPFRLINRTQWEKNNLRCFGLVGGVMVNSH